jgi:hypothetical protein
MTQQVGQKAGAKLACTFDRRAGTLHRYVDEIKGTANGSLLVGRQHWD